MLSEIERLGRPRQACSVGDLCYLGCDGNRDPVNISEWRVTGPTIQRCCIDLFGESLRGHEKHLIGDEPGPGADDSETEPREDVRIVSLSGNERPAVRFDGIERTT